ncbi:MAG: hypothetical protein LLG93_12605 [Deltaproteobacteria bacterium]|nr:hypothetical protein [Deltaproteobacteria bacterium]
MKADIQCTYCGHQGKLGRRRTGGKRDGKTFKFIGSNPFSGHLHYQCPVCAIVLLVPPGTIREGRDFSKPVPRERTHSMQIARL